MALISYSNVSEGPRQFIQGAKQQGRKSAGQLFSSGSAMGSYSGNQQFNENRINEAINAWGVDIARDWDRNGAMLIDAVRQDIKDLRIQAQQARKANDLERYRLALDQIMFDKQMLMYANELEQARKGDILTGVIAGLGQFGAGLGERKSRIQELEQTKKFYSDLENEIDWKRSYTPSSPWERNAWS